LGTAHLDLADDRYTFSVVAADPEFRTQPEAAHAALAVLVRMSRMSLSEGFQPLQVLLRHPASGCDGALRDYFGCPIEYGTERYGLVMAAADLDHQLPTANIEILTNAEQMIADYLGQLDQDDTVARAKAEILRQLPSGTTTEETIAAALNMSLRTFQRRLSDRGTVYREVLESVRRDLALKYIATPRLSITEISYLLGFSEPSSFARTFRRWTGTSPSQQRERAA
jgi:AraC-like DNA-binding protein